MNNSTIPLPTAAQQAAAHEGSNVTLIAVALLMGVVAAGINYWYIMRVQNQVDANSVVVWKLVRAVQPGERFNAERDVAETKLPKQYTESLKLIADKDHLLRQNKQVFTRAAEQGEFISDKLFTGSTELIESKISEGRRACPLPINGRNASGILRPGMSVDLLGDFTPPGTKTTRSMVVMQNLKVLAVGSNIDETGKTSRSGFTNITVDVDLDTAEKLITISHAIGRDGFDVLPRSASAVDRPFSGVNKKVLEYVGLEQP